MIHVTEKAAQKIKEIAEAEGLSHCQVRVKVIGGGCAGFSYDMCYDELIDEMDEVVEMDGIKVLVDPLSFQYLDEVLIDYQEGPITAGFKFINPNASGSCGCGSSFSV